MAMFAEHNGYICRVMQRCQIAIAGMASSYRRPASTLGQLLQTIPLGTLLQTIPLGTSTEHTAEHAPTDHTAGHAPAGHTAGHAKTIPPGTLLQTIPLGTPTDHTARHAPAGHTAGHAKTIPLGTQNAAELRSPAARSNQFSSFANALRNSVNASAQASSVAYCWLCAMHSSSSQTLSC